MTHMRPNVILPAANFYIASSLPRYNMRWSRLELWIVMPFPFAFNTDWKLEWLLHCDSNKRQARPVRGFSLIYSKKKLWTDISAKMLHICSMRGERGKVIVRHWHMPVQLSQKYYHNNRTQRINLYLLSLKASLRPLHSSIFIPQCRYTEQQSAVTPNPNFQCVMTRK